MRNLYLIGPMGSGKTTVGRLVAERLRRPFVDTDVVIAQKAGCSIPEIFARGGEEGFRRLETAVLQGLGDRLVVATGGGLVLAPQNREYMRATGRVIWLQVSPDELFRRISQGDGIRRRPLLQGDDPAGALRAIVAGREALYRAAADIVVGTDGLLPLEAAEAVLKRLEVSRDAGKGTP